MIRCPIAKLMVDKIVTRNVQSLQGRLKISLTTVIILKLKNAHCDKISVKKK